MATKCQTLNAEHLRIDREHTQAMKKLAIEEFPVGTKVRYIYTFDRNNEKVYRTAIVKSHNDWYVTLSGPSGGSINKRAHELYPLEESES